MAKNSNRAGFSIEVGCPGCGGELALEEGFFVLNCSHCGSNLRIKMPDIPAAFLVKGKLQQSQIRFHIDRYLKERDLPLTTAGPQIKNLYYPYWKIDATQVRVRNRLERREIRQASEYVDAVYSEREKSEISISPYKVTVAAGPRMDGVPVSIGLRADYLQLHVFSDEEIQESFDTLPVVRHEEDALTNAAMKFASVGEVGVDAIGINKTDLLDPDYAIIYFPYHIVELYDNNGYSRYLLDGVCGAVLHHRHPLDKAPPGSGADGFGFESNLQAERFGWSDTVVNTVPDDVLEDATRASEEDETDFAASGPIEFGALEVDFHRCPNCGQDLPAGQSHVYICLNCHVMVLLEQPDIPVNNIVQTSIDDTRKDRLFPFWSFRISEANRVLMRRLFGGIFESDRLVIPAFYMPNYEAIYRLCKRMSTAVPKLELTDTDAVDNRFMSVDIGPNRATTIAVAVIYREMLTRDQDTSPDDVRFAPTEVDLVFASFHAESYFYVDSVLGAVTFEKSLVG